MEKTLQNISCNIIRKNWQEYKEIIDKNSFIYGVIWEDWENKHNNFTENIFYPILKKFITENHIGRIEPYKKYYYIIQENETTIILKGLHNVLRKNVHLLCDKLGSHHNSVNINGKKNKHLYIYKPKIWLWEYTEINPYSKNEDYYKEKEKKITERKIKYIEKMEHKYCYNCDQNGLETQLYSNVYIRGLFCNECLEILSDCNGGKLCDHKFEPI